MVAKVRTGSLSGTVGIGVVVEISQNVLNLAPADVRESDHVWGPKFGL